ncbi:ThiF family adenylyltransferase [Paraburkholderia sediminicola]|uniref:ThiF family adenylyltransferase n=1 Tax=Paraburkholderia sediminicola TaxID=458836 RepID=UPI0038BB39F8
MSLRLIALNPDLQRLRDEGYELEIRSNYLLVHSVPYVNSRREVARGTLVSEMNMASPGVLDRPNTHQIYFVGEHPCNPDGSELVQIKNGTTTYQLGDNLVANHYFSNKPKSGAYENYYEKVTSYVRVISNQAKAIDPAADARTWKTVDSIEEESVFLYEDTASSRAGIQAIAARLKHQRIAIVGLGGTGAYVLDLVAKTHVTEIHLYDGDRYRQHNAFRSPGAASRGMLERRLSKVAYWVEVYSAMRTGIVPHEVMINETNVAELYGYDFVFVCVDKGEVRQLIVNALERQSTRFVDVGMGINLTDDRSQLWGTCRVTTSTPETRLLATARIPKVDRDDEVYGSNIQIADLNCLNATLAVMKWKRLSEFYINDRAEYDSTYNVNLNQLTNEEGGS